MNKSTPFSVGELVLTNPNMFSKTHRYHNMIGIVVSLERHEDEWFANVMFPHVDSECKIYCGYLYPVVDPFS